MAIADWVIVKSNAAHNVSLTTVNPLVDTASLEFDTLAGGSGQFNMYRNLVGERGYIRGVFQFLVSPTGQSSGNFFGVTCMNSALDVTAAGTSCYLVGYNGSVGGKSLFVRKYTNGLGNTGSSLASTAFTINNNEILPIEVEWNFDLGEFGGTRLVLRRGIIGQTTFTGLTDVHDISDSSSPLSTSVAEGPAGVWSASQSPYKMDELEHFLLTPA